MELDMGRDHDNESKSRSRSRSHSHSLEARDGRSRSRYRTRSRSRSRSHDRDYYYERERHSRSRSDEESNSLRAYWKPVKDDPSNFEAWTQLLHYIEQLDETKAAREAYDEFLKRYPFCYGYWRKYAEFERRHKHYERSVKVYEYGVSAIQLSVDLWLHYIAFIREIVQHQENSIEKTRVLYNRALEACGLEFRSDKLWEEYISWELNNNEPNRVGLLYDQLLSIPTLMYSNHFGRYQAFVNSNEPDQVVNQEEYNEILKKAQEDLKKAQPTELYIEEEFIDESPPDCIPENGEEPPRKVIFRRKHSEDALRIMRQEIIERRRKKHVANEREVSRRWPFEENIKRSYFHVKPLETAQLRNWHDYLNFEIENGDTHRTIILFERCVIACAMYEEMWTKYARYLDGTGESARALRVLHRAAGIHLPNSPTIHLAYSALEEKYGNYESASNILADFDHRHPGYAIIALRRIGIDRRFAQKHAGDKEGSDYSDVISRFERLIHNPQTPRRLSSFYALKLARFHLKVRNDRRLCEKIVRDALNRDKDNTQLFLMLVDLAFTSPSYKESDVIAALDFALASEDLSDEDKLKFSQRKLDFLEDLGSDISELQDHLEFHAKLQESIGCGQSTPKRKTDMSPLGEPLDKRSRSTSYIAPQILPQQQLPAYGTVAPAYQFSPTVIPYYYSSQQTLQQTTQTSSTIPQLQQTY